MFGKEVIKIAILNLSLHGYFDFAEVIRNLCLKRNGDNFEIN